MIDTQIDELTHDIKRKADLLDSAEYEEFPRLCGEIRERKEMREKMPANKLPNEYQKSLTIYATCPKAVFAALAVSFARRIYGDNLSAAEIETELLNEWNTLYQGHHVPQKPKDPKG